MEAVQMLLQIRISCEDALILPLISILFSSWEEKIDENLANPNLLSEGKFPENFRGILEAASCLASESKNFEEIEVIKCTKQANIFECEVSVTEPTKIVEFLKLCPVIYEDTMLKLGENIILAKEMSINKLKFLIVIQILFHLPCQIVRFQTNSKIASIICK